MAWSISLSDMVAGVARPWDKPWLDEEMAQRAHEVATSGGRYIVVCDGADAMNTPYDSFACEIAAYYGGRKGCEAFVYYEDVDKQRTPYFVSSKYVPAQYEPGSNGCVGPMVKDEHVYYGTGSGLYFNDKHDRDPTWDETGLVRFK
jgi:hypothetical protein